MGLGAGSGYLNQENSVSSGGLGVCDDAHRLGVMKKETL
jgi:hypothetical protein